MMNILSKYKWAVAAAVVIVLAWVLVTRATVINRDTTVAGPYDERNVRIENGATLTVDGDLKVAGTYSCENGPLTIVVNGNAEVNGKLECERENIAEGAPAFGVSLVVSGSLTFGEGARVVSNGHVQIVADAGYLLKTQEQIDETYREAAEPSGGGPRIGPFVGEGGAAALSGTLPRVARLPFASEHARPETASAAFLRGVSIVNAQNVPPRDDQGNVVPNVIIGGKWYVGNGGNPPGGLDVPTPPRGVNKIILNFNFGANGNVALRNFYLAGPDGAQGKSDEGANCNARGEDGKDAMRFRVRAANINVDQFTIELGDGGAGGVAVTKKDCDPGVAKGGQGGEAGNFKMTAEGKITIASMRIIPGAGGNGGYAEAYGKDGKDGCPGEKGGDAAATGGRGGDNKKELSATGAVEGVGNITIDEVIGGFGGEATAEPGKGGNGTGCNCKGGAGGKATATGGAGGKASIKVARGGNPANATGGDGGDADATGGAGGNGGHCPLKPSGGDGGKGGDATGKAGKGGTGSTANGTDGDVLVEKGGNGGNGGDGCGPGNGGKGGNGRDPGTDGEKGKLICPEEKKETFVDPGRDEGKTDGGKQVRVIRYGGKYLPVDQLIIEDEVGCGADHWHAAQGVVIATDGSQVFDPGPQCGFGKVRDNPATDALIQPSGSIQFDFRIR